MKGRRGGGAEIDFSSSSTRCTWITLNWLRLQWVGGLIREVVVVVEQVVNRVELNLDWPHSGRPLSLHAI